MFSRVLPHTLLDGVRSLHAPKKSPKLLMNVFLQRLSKAELETTESQRRGLDSTIVPFHAWLMTTHRTDDGMTCVFQCGDGVIAPEFVEEVSEYRCILNFWSCEKCAYQFESK